MQQVRNEFLNTFNYISEFKIGQYQNADDFLSLLERSRGVHVENNNTNIVKDIDEAMDILRDKRFSKKNITRLDKVCRESVLPFTYSPDVNREDRILCWHTHPTGLGPSRRDLSNSECRPSLIVPYKTGRTEFYFLLNGKNYEHIDVPEPEENVDIMVLTRR